MFDRFNSFKSYSVSKIQNLVKSHYVFYWQLYKSAYITDLLYKN